MAAKKKKKLDRNALFTIQTISRADIADQLNCGLEGLELTDEELDGLYFDQDDPRLTDEVCKELASELYDADAGDEEADQIVFTNFASRFAK